MADEPQKVNIQATRIDASILPPGFSLPYRLYVMQQTSDLKNLADSSNNANDLAHQATIKNGEQDAELTDHEDRISALRVEVDNHDTRIAKNTNDIAVIDERVTDAEVNISAIQGDYISKSSSTNQMVQSSGGDLLIGNVTSPTTDKLQVAGSENVSVSYKVASLQVIGPRQTGWTASTGTAAYGEFLANQPYDTGVTYLQSEARSVAVGLFQARQRIKALEDAMRNHGLIN